MDLMDLYRSLLKAAGLQVTADGFVNKEFNGDILPATKSGKQLVLPTLDQLRSPTYKDKLVFHPLYDNPLQGESEVLAFYRHMLIHNLNCVISALMLDLITVASETDRHSKLTPDQQEFLTGLQTADKRTHSDFEKLILEMPAGQVQKMICSIFPKKTGKVKGKNFKQISSVSFPFYEELMAWERIQKDKKLEKEAGIKARKTKESGTSAHEIYGVPLRERDRDNYIELMRYIFPQIDEIEAYNRGSNSDVSARMDALMQSFGAIAGNINSIIDLFKGVIVDIEKYSFDSDWVEAFNNLESMHNQVRNIPNQSSVDIPQPMTSSPQAMMDALSATQTPVVPVEVKPPPEPMPWRNLIPPPYQPVTAQPYQNNVATNYQANQYSPPQQSNTGGGTSLAAILQADPRMRSMIPGQHQQPQYNQYPNNGNYGNGNYQGSNRMNQPWNQNIVNNQGNPPWNQKINPVY